MRDPGAGDTERVTCRMLRLTGIVTLLAVAAGQVAGQAPPPPYRVTWWDAASVATAAGLAVIDRVALHTFSGPAATASTALLAGVVGFAGLASLDGASAEQARGRAAVLANAVGWTFATTEWVKVLTHRNRPVLYTAGAPAAASNPDNRRSFPSGHASVAFAAATAYVVMAGRE